MPLARAAALAAFLAAAAAVAAPREEIDALLERRGALQSAEQFIAQVASASSTTGTPYLVQCGKAAPVTSAAWLTGQLKSLRAKR